VNIVPDCPPNGWDMAIPRPICPKPHASRCSVPDDLLRHSGEHQRNSSHGGLRGSLINSKFVKE
jgi:hypothetical protein